MRKITVSIILLFCAIPEYVLVTTGQGKTYVRSKPFESNILGILSIVDILVMLLFIAMAVFTIKSPISSRSPWKREISRFLILVTMTIFASLFIAFIRGNSNPFFFTKPFVLGILIFTIARRLILDEQFTVQVLRIVDYSSIIYGIFLIYQIATAETLVNGIIYYSPLYVYLFVFFKNFSNFIYGAKTPWLSKISLLVSTLVIIFSMVRSIWVSFAIGIILILTNKSVKNLNLYQNIDSPVKKLGRVVSIIFASSILLSALSFLDNFLYRRILAFNVFAAPNLDAIGWEDNGDHRNELIYAVQAVKENWLIGAGIGAGYETPSSSYRYIAIGFHNSFATVWFWYGIVGVLLWTAYPFLMTKWLTFAGRESESKDLKILRIGVIPVWIKATYIPGIFFQTWQFTSVPYCIFFALVMAISFSDKRRL
jgi:hypothetical protein